MSNYIHPPYALRRFPSPPVCFDCYVGVPNEQQHEIRDWCEEQFGPQGPNPDEGRWFFSYYTIFFNDPNDAFAFKMRWL